MSTTMDESSQDEGFNTDFLFKNNKSYNNENRELYCSAVYLKNLIMAVNTNMSWPPDSNDLTFENALKVLPTELLSFLKVMLGFSNQTQITEHISVPEAEEKKVASIAQDLIHVATSGRTLTHKAISLGVTVRQITGSQRVTQVLNQFGHFCSPDVLYKHDSALTESIMSL